MIKKWFIFFEKKFVVKLFGVQSVEQTDQVAIPFVFTDPEWIENYMAYI